MTERGAKAVKLFAQHMRLVSLGVKTECRCSNLRGSSSDHVDAIMYCVRRFVYVDMMFA